MIHVTIRRSPCFDLHSYGNGTAYALEQRVAPGNSLLIQGDDAGEFRAELAAYEASHPHESTETVLREFWARYH